MQQFNWRNLNRESHDDWSEHQEDKMLGVAHELEPEKEALADLPKRKWWQWRLKRRDIKEHLKAEEDR